MNLTTRLLLAALCAAAGCLIGLFFAKRLKARESYFNSFNQLINQILSEVKFRKNTIKDIAKEFLKNNKSQFSTTLKEFISAETPKDAKFSKGLLKEDELSFVREFFFSIGCVDSQTQIFELENYKEKANSIYLAAKTKREKFFSMIVKLGFFAGLAVGILIL